jgi:hypothetical protein
MATPARAIRANKLAIRVEFDKTQGPSQRVTTRMITMPSRYGKLVAGRIEKAVDNTAAAT